MVGCLSEKNITESVIAKNFRSLSHEIKGNEPSSHDYTTNYTSASKTMEIDVALALCESLFFNPIKITLQNKVSGDDSTMRILLNHVTTHLRGCLNIEIPDFN